MAHRERSIPAGDPLAGRLRVYLLRGRLDRRIACGDRCDSTDLLAIRASQLTHPRTRHQTARGLRRIVGYADRLGSRPNFSAVMIERAAVIAGRQAILGLAERLDGAAQVSPRGVALARQLLSDGLSPLFNRHAERSVIQAIWEVEDALEADAPVLGSGAVSS
jgi:hypothetical protein